MPPETVEKVEQECSRGLLEWYRQGQPHTGPHEHQVWKDAQEAAIRDYRSRHPNPYHLRKAEERRQKEQQQEGRTVVENGDGNIHQIKMDLAIGSTKNPVENVPRVAQRVAEDMKAATPGVVNALNAGWTRNTQMTLRNVQRPKVAVLP